MQIIRSLFVSGIVMAFVQVAQSLPIISTMTQSSLPTEGLSVGKLEYAAATSYMGWHGRILELSETGLTYTPVRWLALGAAYRNTYGHGQSGQTTYNANGWEAWGSLRLLRERGQRPEITLSAQEISDAIVLQKVTSTEDDYAAPPVTTDGIDLCATRHLGKDAWQLDAGTYEVHLLEEMQATVLALGARYNHPFTSHMSGQLAMAGYQDNYLGGRRHTYVLQAGLRVGSPETLHLEFAGSYFPRGIPLAGTPFSPAAMVGAFYGGNSTAADLDTQACGYLTLLAVVPF